MQALGTYVLVRSLCPFCDSPHLSQGEVHISLWLWLLWTHTPAFPLPLPLYYCTLTRSSRAEMQAYNWKHYFGKERHNPKIFRFQISKETEEPDVHYNEEKQRNGRGTCPSFEDGEGPQAKDQALPQEGGRGKKTDSPLESPERN